VIAIWELMKKLFLAFKIPDKQRKIVINKRCGPATAGAKSPLVLLKVPLRDALSLQMEQMGDPNELSW